MLTEWTSREKKLAVTICILALLLLSMLFSAWIKKDGTKQTEFMPQSFGQMELVEKNEVDQPNSGKSLSKEQQELSTESIPETVMVDIKGAVHKPYVYLMQADERVIDVIDQAGGLLATASTVSTNLAQKVFDGMVIYIPTEEELQLGTGEAAINALLAQNNVSMPNQGSSSTGKININSASATELESLPGIGPSRSKAIISYREEKGLFSTPEDLMNVSGIGPKIFANLKDEIELR